ncbi:MAG TPA: Clp protease N-terminal domain-containing protein, partial [Mycobacteriales bacterium]|nr:Clp protease N-terminal domain-containing protein [Mycobacteriales bacterium]
MDANQLTTKSQEAYAAAARRALREGNPAVEPEHLLWAVLQDDQGIALQVLDAAGADRDAVREDAEKAVTGLPRASGASVSAPAPSGALQRVVATAIDLASARGDTYVSTELLLLGLATVGGHAADLLRDR